MDKKKVRANFRKSVFGRSKYCCDCCGARGYDRQEPEEDGKVPLDAHHILGREEFENGGYVKENGITVCTDCHLKAEQFHISGGKKWEEGFHPDDLYAKIGSSLEAAIEADVDI